MFFLNLLAHANSTRVLQVRPEQLESLDDLLMQAKDCANFSRCTKRCLPPTLVLVGPDGPLSFMPWKAALHAQQKNSI